MQSWEDIDKLNSFPKLEEVRLLGIPLLQPYTTEERRKLVVARYVILIPPLLLSEGALKGRILFGVLCIVPSPEQIVLKLFL